MSLRPKEYIWLDTTSREIDSVLLEQMILETIQLDLEGLLNLAHLFRRVINFRSTFTANHSSGIAASAEALADSWTSLNGSAR